MRKKQLILPIVISLLIILSFITLNSVYANTINVMQVSGDGIQEYLTKPCGWHYEGTYNRTYFTYTDGDGSSDWLIRYYDHDTDTFSSETYLGNWGGGEDDHVAPSLVINDTGYIFVFMCGHSNNYIKLRISSLPEQIAFFESPATIYSGRASYPKPWIMENGTMAVSWRGRTDTSCQGIAYSYDNGSTWDSSWLTENAAYAQIYQEEEDNDYIHFVYTDPVITGDFRKDLYYMYSDDGGYSWYNSDDDSVTIPASWTDMTKCWDEEQVRQLDFYSNSSHNAHILANGDLGNANDTIPLFHIWYNGTGWESEQLPIWQDVFRTHVTHDYTNGACFDHDDWRVVYAGYKNGTGNDADVKVIFYNETTGEWEHGADVTTGGSNCKVRPMPIRNPSSEIAFTFADGTYTTYTSYNTDLNCGSQFIIGGGGGSPPTPDDETQFQTINDKTNNSVICTPSRYFNWSKIDDVNLECYDLQIANDSDFTSVFVNLTDVNETNYGINYTEKGNYVEFILPYAYNISYYGEHHYRVRARYYGS